MLANWIPLRPFLIDPATKGLFFLKMTRQEAIVKTRQMRGIKHDFGIIGSAMMPVSDISPTARIAFWAVRMKAVPGLRGPVA